MSGETVPYRLRPHKAVDRRLFLALLGRCERWVDLRDHVYVSMDGETRAVHLADGPVKLAALATPASSTATCHRRPECGASIETRSGGPC